MAFERVPILFVKAFKGFQSFCKLVLALSWKWESQIDLWLTAHVHEETGTALPQDHSWYDLRRLAEVVLACTLHFMCKRRCRLAHETARPSQRESSLVCWVFDWSHNIGVWLRWSLWESHTLTVLHRRAGDPSTKCTFAWFTSPSSSCVLSSWLSWDTSSCQRYCWFWLEVLTSSLP